MAEGALAPPIEVHSPPSVEALPTLSSESASGTPTTNTGESVATVMEQNVLDVSGATTESAMEALAFNPQAFASEQYKPLLLQQTSESGNVNNDPISQNKTEDSIDAEFANLPNDGQPHSEDISIDVKSQAEVNAQAASQEQQTIDQQREAVFRESTLRAFAEMQITNELFNKYINSMSPAELKGWIKGYEQWAEQQANRMIAGGDTRSREQIIDQLSVTGIATFSSQRSLEQQPNTLQPSAEIIPQQNIESQDAPNTEVQNTQETPQLTAEQVEKQHQEQNLKFVQLGAEMAQAGFTAEQITQTAQEVAAHPEMMDTIRTLLQQGKEAIQRKQAEVRAELKKVAENTNSVDKKKRNALIELLKIIGILLIGSVSSVESLT